VAEKIIEKQNFHLDYFIAGVIIIDLVFAAIAFLGYHHLIMNTGAETLLMIAGGVFVIFLGFYGLIRKDTKISRVFRSERSSPIGQFFKGVILCGTNPAFLLFWIFIAAQLTNITHNQLSITEVLILLISIGAGTRLWFFLYIRLLKNGMDRLNWEWIGYIRKGISISLVLLGVATLLFLS